VGSVFGSVDADRGARVANHRSSPDGRYTLAFDGELDAPEGLLVDYEKNGKAAIERIRGGFSLALWDARAESLVLARDRLGAHPLYFATAPGRIHFAESVRALVDEGIVENRLSRRGIASFLATGAVIEPDTILEGVSPLPPATILEWKGGHTRTGTYWEIPLDARPERDPGEADASARAALMAAVRLRLPADEPTVLRDGSAAAELVAMTAAALTDKPLRTITAPHLLEAPAPEELLSAIAALDQPSSGFLDAFLAAKTARDAGVTIALGAPGGDLLLAPRSRPRLAAGTVERDYAALLGTSTGDEIRALVSADIADDLFVAITVPERLEPLLARGDLSPSDALVRLEITNRLRDQALRDAYVASRAHGLCLRAPLVDPDLVTRLGDLPVTLRRARPEAPRPLGAWLAGPLRGFAEALLLDELPRRAPFLDARAIARLFRDFLAGDARVRPSRLFDLALLVAYLRAHGASI